MHSQMLKNINCIAGILQETSKILTGDDGHSALILIWHLCVHNTAMLITNRIWFQITRLIFFIHPIKIGIESWCLNL